MFSQKMLDIWGYGELSNKRLKNKLYKKKHSQAAISVKNPC